VPFGVRRLVALAHEGVRVRERAKSLLVRCAATMKAGIRLASTHLVVEGRIPDEDLVFFFTLEELERLVEREDPALVALAKRRREALPSMMKLEFAETFRGAAEPRTFARVTTGEKLLYGKPVSRGVARGRARVARSVDEAHHVEPGEILIATITDVGWTPCFSVIAGIATDIGSAVSHGAVVAREYGIPAVVSLERATHVFETGDRVVLDADLGILKLDDEHDD
jgi:pyruvate,water dikinase